MFALFSQDKLTKNYEDAIFEKLAKQANFYKKSTCYFVEFDSDNNYFEKWILSTYESSLSHKNVYKISIAKFYELLTKRENAIYELIDSTTEIMTVEK